MAEQTALEAALKVKRFFGEKAEIPTPLRVVSGGDGANQLDLGCLVMIKDENGRLGQRAFKSIGAGYAVAQSLVAHRNGKAVEYGSDFLDGVTTFQQLCDGAAGEREKNEIRVATASDGNHGASVAWAANSYGAKGVVYLPKGAAQDRVDRIASFNAQVVVSELSYDDTVRLVAKTAQEKGWLLVQDTAWDGYTAIPRHIMDGYCLIAHEALAQAEELGAVPTHVFLQVGVGSFASAIVQYVREKLGPEPKIFTVEPVGSACMYWSIVNGKPTTVSNSPPTVCVGLDCGEISSLAWPIMKGSLSGVIAFHDRVAARGVQALSSIGVRCGESGAATGVGILLSLGQDQKASMGLNPNSKVLAFNTEGVTDHVATEKILGSDPVAVLDGDIQIHLTAE